MSTCKVSYSGTALPTDSNTFTLFSTVTAAGFPDFFAYSGTKRFVLRVKNSHAGTLKAYRSANHGTNWSQIDEVAVVAAAATDENAYDFFIEGFRDWKLDWVNGGTTQTTFSPDMALDTDRAKSA